MSPLTPDLSEPPPRSVQLGAVQEETEQELTREVLSVISRAGSPRLRQLLTGLVACLHGFVREVRVTQDEFQAAAAFLNEAGQASTGRRDESMLIADLLGLTALVAVVNDDPRGGATESTLIGPFFEDESPSVPLGGDVSAGARGTPLWVEGSIRDTAGLPVPAALVEVWGSDADGLYDIQYPDRRTANRARLVSDADGGYRFWTVRPVPYPLPADGPGGRLMRAVGNSGMRSAHLHMKVSAPGCRTLVTHVFDAGDDYLSRDGVFGVRESLARVIDEVPAGVPGPGGRQADGPWARVRFDVVLASAADLPDPNAEVLLCKDAG